MGFVHLHVHTEFSFLDGECRIKDLVSHAKKLGMTSLAITDHGNMCGVIDFYKECRAQGIKPLIGCEVYVAARDMNEKSHDNGNTTHHLVLIAKNNEGYKNLVKIVSKGWIDGFYYKPRVDFSVIEQYHEGLICMSACLAGEIPRAILTDEDARARALVEQYHALFGKDFYLEIQNHGIAEQKKVNAALIRLANEYNIGLVATNDVHYIEKSDAKYQDLLMCIQMNRKVRDADRMAFETDEFYLKEEQEMKELFGAIPDALTNTEKIAEQCDVTFEFGVLKLPQYDVPDGKDSYTYLTELCEEGLLRRYGDNAEAKERLYFELEVIKNMGYVDYFLIVWDFIKYAKDNGIPVGPGRGSAAGSIVSYCLEITNIDPIRFGLIFERFLNPERVSMPDIDVDFCNEDRQRVIDYVVEKYGRERVCQIITFNKMKAKNAIRDVGRVLDVSYGDTDAIAKMIPFDLKMTIEKALKLNPDLKAKYDTDAIAKELIDDAIKLEGLIRNAGTHAAGVVIAKEPVTEYLPLQKNDDVIITQFPKDTVEELGLLKMDFLGLRNLGIIKDALNIIKASTGEEIDIDAINLNEPEVYKMIGRGETEGVFQLESAGMKQFMKELKPESIEDIIAGISLYRPGPMDQIPRYVANKENPQQVQYKHEMLEPILDVTYGCMVYQEQVMEIVRKMGGYSLGRADLVRRAMSKKKADVMAEERKNFIHGIVDDEGNVLVDGAVRRGVSETVANDIFDEMMDFAEYAFNKSHAAAYAFVTYQTAYLKHFYPAQYMAALLSSVLDSPEKVAKYSQDATRMGIKILPPDINESIAGFAVQSGDIRFGLAVIKNVGVGCIDGVVAERTQNGEYKNYKDFAKRTIKLGVTKRVHEYLIKAGAFDSLGEKRSYLLAEFESILDSYSDDLKRNIEGQINLFGDEDEFLGSKTPYDIPELSPKELLKFEKESIGYYISGHPLNEYADEIEGISTITFADFVDSGHEEMAISDLTDGMPVRVCVLASGIKTKVTKNNKIMAFVTVEDLTGQAEIIVFPNVYERSRKYLVEDAPLIISGKLSFKEEEEPKILCDIIEPLEHGAGARLSKTEIPQVSRELKAPSHKKLFLKFVIGKEYLLERVKPLLRKFPGNIPVYIHYEERKQTAIAPKNLWISDSDALISSLEEMLGKSNVVLK